MLKKTLFLSLLLFVAREQLMANYNFCEEPCAWEQNCCDDYFFGEIDYLYWQGKMGNLTYAFHSDTTADGPAISSAGRLENLDFSWNSGVRAALGYGNGRWEFGIFGTYYSSKSKGSATAGSDLDSEALIPMWFPAYLGFAAASADSEWMLKFGLLDLLATYYIPLNPCLTIAPNFGLRAVWIKNDYKANYNTVIFPISGGPSLFFPQTGFDLGSKYQAIGFKGGADFDILLVRCLSLEGNIGGSLVYGRMKLNQEINGAILAPDASALVPFQSTLHEVRHWLRANFESEVALTYRYCFNCFRGSLSAGYFMGIWFDQNDFLKLFFTTTVLPVAGLNNNHPVADESNDNLQLHGLFVRAAFEF